MSDVHETLVRLRNEVIVIKRELQDLIQSCLVTTTNHVNWFDDTKYELDVVARNLDKLIEANPPWLKAYRVQVRVSCVVECEDARDAIETVDGRLKQDGFDVTGWTYSVEVVS